MMEEYLALNYNLQSPSATSDPDLKNKHLNVVSRPLLYMQLKRTGRGVHRVFDIDWHLSIFSPPSYPLDQTTAHVENEDVSQSPDTLNPPLTLISHRSRLHRGRLSPSHPLPLSPLKVHLPFNKLRLQIHFYNKCDTSLEKLEGSQ